MTGNVRPIENVRPEVGDTVATEQPGSIPILESPPTIDDLPKAANGEPAGLIYEEQGTGTVKVSLPDGTGGVATATLADLSASVSLDIGDTTGLL